MTAAKHETVKVDVGLEESAVCMMEIASAPPKWIAYAQNVIPRDFGSGRLFGDDDLIFVCLGFISGGRSCSSKENYPDSPPRTSGPSGVLVKGWR